MFKKIYKKLFLSENYHHVKFLVLNMKNEEVWNKYHCSVGYFCEEVILNEGRKLKGMLDIYGHDKTNVIVVAYDNQHIAVHEIQSFLEGFGIKVKQTENKPFKKFFGLFTFKKG